MVFTKARNKKEEKEKTVKAPKEPKAPKEAQKELKKPAGMYHHDTNYNLNVPGDFLKIIIDELALSHEQLSRNISASLQKISTEQFTDYVKRYEEQQSI